MTKQVRETPKDERLAALARDILKEWDAPHYGDYESLCDRLFDPIEALRKHLKDL